MKTQTKHKQAALSEPNLTTQPSNSIPNDACELNSTLESQNQVKAEIKQITDRLFGLGIDSTNRLPAMLHFLNYSTLEPEVVWPVFHAVWNACDATWECHDKLIELLDLMECLDDGEGMRPIDYLTPEDKAAFAALPKHIWIYRGCSISCVYGFSWTTDRKIAEGFARGHRGISVPDPVIASFRIPKSAVMGFYTSRKENEVFINFDYIKNYVISVTKFIP